MIVCAFDVRPRSIRLVLVGTAHGPDILEGCCLPAGVSVERVLRRLRGWQKDYASTPFTLVACKSDPLPASLYVGLQEAGYEFQWVDATDVAAALRSWSWTRLDPRWLRGGLMSFLLGSPLSAYGEHHDVAAWRWAYTYFRKQVADLEPWVHADFETVPAAIAATAYADVPF